MITLEDVDFWVKICLALGIMANTAHCFFLSKRISILEKYL